MIWSEAPSNRLSRGAVVAGSLVAHGLVLALLAIPQIESFPDRSDDEGALTVTLERMPPPPAPSTAPSTAMGPRALSEIQPRVPRAVYRSTVAPLALPGRAPSPARGTALHPAPLPEGPKGDLRAALRASGVGCANPAATGLNRREIDRCHERWGEAARKAPQYADAPIDPRKRAAFDQVAAEQAAYRRYLDAPMGPGVDHRSRDGLGRAKEIPFVMGNMDGIGRTKSDQSLGIKP